MVNIILAVLVQSSILGADQQDFDKAYRHSMSTGKPMVVLIGARWCGACQKMKHSVLPRVVKVVGTNKVVFTYVDFDKQRHLAARLSRARSIPQLIRFDRTPSGWKSKYLVGAKSPREVYDFINAGLTEKSKPSGVSVADRSKKDPRPSSPTEPVRAPSAVAESSSHFAVDAPGRRQPEVGSSAVEKAGRVPDWTLFFKTLFVEGANRRKWTARAGDRPNQAREPKKAAASPKPRQVGIAGPALGMGHLNVAASTSTDVSGETASWHNSRKSKDLRPE